MWYEKYVLAVVIATSVFGFIEMVRRQRQILRREYQEVYGPTERSAAASPWKAVLNLIGVAVFIFALLILSLLIAGGHVRWQ